MALPPMQSKQLLAQSLADMEFDSPIINSTLDPMGLVTSSATIFLPTSGGNTLEQTYTATPSDTIEIAEDKAARMALEGLRTHFDKNPHAGAYLREKVFRTTTRAWQDACAQWGFEYNKLDMHNRDLHIELYKQAMTFNNVTRNYSNLIRQQCSGLEAELKTAHNDINRLQCCNLTLQNKIEKLEKTRYETISTWPEISPPSCSSPTLSYLGMSEVPVSYETLEEAIGTSLATALE